VVESRSWAEGHRSGDWLLRQLAGALCSPVDVRPPDASQGQQEPIAAPRIRRRHPDFIFCMPYLRHHLSRAGVIVDLMKQKANHSKECK